MTVALTSRKTKSLFDLILKLNSLVLSQNSFLIPNKSTNRFLFIKCTIRRSIALNKFYQTSFESDSIGVGAWQQNDENLH